MRILSGTEYALLALYSISLAFGRLGSVLYYSAPIRLLIGAFIAVGLMIGI